MDESVSISNPGLGSIFTPSKLGSNIKSIPPNIYRQDFIVLSFKSWPTFRQSVMTRAPEVGRDGSKQEGFEVEQNASGLSQ